VLFQHAKGLLAFGLITIFSIFFELVDLTGDNYGLGAKDVWLQVLDFVLLIAQAGALGLVIYLRPFLVRPTAGPANTTTHITGN